jgi:hypothetical protein
LLQLRSGGNFLKLRDAPLPYTVAGKLVGRTLDRTAELPQKPALLRLGNAWMTSPVSLND